MATLKTTIINYFMDKAKVARKARTVRTRRSQQIIYRKVRDSLQCTNVTLDNPRFFLGGAAGTYSKGTIKVGSGITGIVLVDILFHEDRHYQQDIHDLHGYHDVTPENYCQPADSLRLYGKQPIEKDARRYAYVNTVRWAKANYSSPRVRLGIWVYSVIMHPFTGISTKKFR